jgi:hypothetical protein
LSRALFEKETLLRDEIERIVFPEGVPPELRR